MTKQIHRNTDSRICGASTVVSGQSSVFVNGLLASVDGDQDSHGAGGLTAACKEVYIGGKKVVIVTNDAQPDTLCFTIGPPHCDPSATGGSPSVFVGE